MAGDLSLIDLLHLRRVIFLNNFIISPARESGALSAIQENLLVALADFMPAMKDDPADNSMRANEDSLAFRKANIAKRFGLTAGQVAVPKNFDRMGAVEIVKVLMKKNRVTGHRSPRGWRYGSSTQFLGGTN